MLKFIKRFYIPLILFILLIVACILEVCGVFDSADLKIMNHIYNIRGEKGGAVYYIFRIITEMGFYYFIIALLLILSIYFKFKKRAFVIIGSVLFNLGFNSLLKIIIRRPRPLQSAMWMSESTYSFPSGHSATSICVYLIIMLISIKTIKNKHIKRALIILSTFAMIAVPLSRLVMGVHYPSDVLSGVIVGSFSASLAYKIFIED